MTFSQARSISTTQTAAHEDLVKILTKHKRSEFKRPVASHTINAFEYALQWLVDWQGDVILDACCGVGESTVKIAQENPDAKIIGVDKSIARLGKHQSYAVKNTSVDATAITFEDAGKKANQIPAAKNYLLLQADLNDFWRLLVNYIACESPKWQIAKQYILYPNPYPKKSQLGKRWHGSALFPFIVKLSANIEVRSNWRLYLEEFLIAAEFYALSGRIETIQHQHIENAYTPFERKYLASDQACFKLLIRP